jgi:hypothetical protein
LNTAQVFIVAARIEAAIWAGILAVLAAIPPLVTWPLELWFQRRGLLQRRLRPDGVHTSQNRQ